MIISLGYVTSVTPPSTCFDEVCKALTMEVFQKCSNDLGIDVGLAMKGYIFDHPRSDIFLSGKDKDLLEIKSRSIGRNWCKWWVLNVLLQKEKVRENVAINNPQKKFERK